MNKPPIFSFSEAYFLHFACPFFVFFVADNNDYDFMEDNICPNTSE